IINNIKQLKLDGYNIIEDHVKGYCLSDNNNYLINYIQMKLNVPFKVVYFKQIDSTNNYCKQRLEEGLNDNIIVLANEQTKGRGRFNNPFISKADVGLYLSIVLKKEYLINKPNLTCLSAVAIIKTIKELYQVQLDIKWVNDLLYDKKKVGGILIEAIYENNSQEVAGMIIGIGLNLFLSNITLDEYQVSSLDQIIKQPLNRNILTYTLINNFFSLLNKSSTYIMNKYQEYSIIVGKQVSFTYNNIQYEGLVQRIRQDGGLVIKTKDTTLNINSGAIKIRGYYE
ncbi:MAG: biotin--[acetyl-CoA-carboxylase] ligase, partial [Bacilli bacterium]